MPSASAAQHRFFGFLHGNPAARERAGISAASVDEHLHADRGKAWARAAGGGLAGYDAGGIVDPTSSGIGGVAPSAQSMNPMMRGMVQRYASLPVEKLQEMAAMMGGSQQGQVIQSVLRQKMAMPNAQPQQGQQQAQQPQQQAAPQFGVPQQPAQAQARGGVTRLAAGGMSMSQGDPWWTRAEASSDNRGAAGFLNGATAGRADAIKTQAPGGSYVIPADVVSGLGEGNSLAGARIIQEAVATGPWGTPLPRQGATPRLPHPTAPQAQAKGGATKPNSAPVPVMLSHGEYVILPEDVTRIGGGDLKHGHKVLDHFVETSRTKLIRKLKSLPGPVKASK